jgi:putative phosphoribosyl transferase
VFRDRSQAGQCLAEALVKHAERDDVIVLGLSPGGVPVAYEVARKLHAPLEMMGVRELGVPGYREQAMGIPPSALKLAAAAQLKELHRRDLDYRGGEGLPELRGRTVILTDDGIATGTTARAAIQAVRQQKPARIIIAVPLASADAVAMLKPFVDDFVTLIVPSECRVIGQWYDNYPQTSDAEVGKLLARAADRELAGKSCPA